MIYNQYDVIKVPFPFTDRESRKARPAAIISHPDYALNSNHYILIMITSGKQSRWVDDIQISDLESAGLPVPSKIRFKIFSLNERLIIGKLGELNDKDKIKLARVLSKYLSFKG